ncbi:homeobox protein BarH-like 2 [Montipora capricornis]|uniref:homeobox protein BarH-like 2 n=1 Tax=Montipora foliosa TaxID=591990 RepID=UPI0035F1EFA7
MFYQDPFLLYQQPPYCHGTSPARNTSNRSSFRIDDILVSRQPFLVTKQPGFQKHRPPPMPNANPLKFGVHSILTQRPREDVAMLQDPSPEVLSQLPVYFRVKPTLRTPSGRRCRKSRTVFTDLQLRVLEKTFSEQKYLDTSNRSKLAQTLGLNETQVKTWFQNRRMKWKKETNSNNNHDLEAIMNKTDEASTSGKKDLNSDEKDTGSRQDHMVQNSE